MSKENARARARANGRTDGRTLVVGQAVERCAKAGNKSGREKERRERGFARTLRIAAINDRCSRAARIPNAGRENSIPLRRADAKRSRLNQLKGR